MSAACATTLIGIVLLLVPGPAAAQTGTAHVVGRVTDETGAALPGVVVTVRRGLVRRQAVSQADGRFDVSGLPPGTYTLTGELPGFDVEIRDVIVTTPDATVNNAFMLRPARPCEPGLTVILPIADVANTSDAIIHARIISVEPTPGVKPDCSAGAVTYTATVITPIKTRPEDMRVVTVQWIEDRHGSERHQGDECIVLLYWDALRSRYAANWYYVLPIHGGYIDVPNDDFLEFKDVPVDRGVEMIRDALRNRR